MVYILLGTGFEESEAVIPLDLLRRGGVEVQTAALETLEVRGSHGIVVQADCLLSQANLEDCEMIVLPGGLGGVRSLRACPAALEAVKTVYHRGGIAAAICAGPTVLSDLGLTRGRRATCYPGMEGQMEAAAMEAVGAVTDGRIITGRAAGAAFDFGLALLRALRGEEKAEAVAREVVYTGGSYV